MTTRLERLRIDGGEGSKKLSSAIMSIIRAHARAFRVIKN
jgi:hypothetical protein